MVLATRQEALTGLDTPEAISRYAARLGIFIWVDEADRSHVEPRARMDATLEAAIQAHGPALRAYKIRRRDEQIEEQRQMWAAGGPQKE